MNELIRLYSMAAAFEYKGASDVFIPDDFIEKFAKLIVIHCCNIVNARHQDINNPNDCLTVLDIKEEFGIPLNDPQMKKD